MARSDIPENYESDTLTIKPLRPVLNFLLLLTFHCFVFCFSIGFRKMRDPLNNLSFTFKKRYERMVTLRKNPKLLLELYEHVHPDLTVNTSFF